MAVLCACGVALADLAAPAELPFGPPPKPARGPNLATALALAQATLSECAARGIAVSVSVVDSAGLAKVTLGADDSTGKTQTSVRKAATAVAFKAKGSELERRASTSAEFAAQIAANPEYNAHPGSVPLWIGGELVGGIGVTGAATHQDDEACAAAALAKIKVEAH